MKTTHGPRWTTNGQVELRVWAPRTERLSVRLEQGDVEMKRGANGYFSYLSSELTEGSFYEFVFPNGQALPDPASRRQPEGVHGPSALFRAETFPWTDASWKGIPLHELILYELHVGAFTEEGTLAGAEARLDDLAALGVTCVELMPIQPFSGERNWGYDGVDLFAVHEAYGGPRAFQSFVDAAHARGIAVCLDVVYNHLGPEGNHLTAFAPYLTPKHKSPWGDGLNFDDHDSGPVRRYMVEAAAQWIADYHVDALRLDAVHAIVDESETHLVAEITEAVERAGKAAGRTVHVIAESDLNDRKVVDPRPRGWGCSAAWADDFHHALHALLTGERESFYADFEGFEPLARALREGFAYQGEMSAFRGRPHGTDTKGLLPENFVFCSQNHDQIGNRPAGDRLAAMIPTEALSAVAVLVALGSGLPMLFMGQEYGEDRPFQYFTSHGDAELGKSVSEGRVAEFIAQGAEEVPDPQDASTFARSKLSHRRDGHHGKLRDLYRDLFALRKKHATAATDWPRVSVEGTVITLERETLAVSVNLGAQESQGLPGFGFRLIERPLLRVANG